MPRRLCHASTPGDRLRQIVYATAAAMGERFQEMGGEADEGQARRQIAFINAAHTLTHYSLLILPTAVLAMATPGGAFGAEYGPILAIATGMFVLYGVGSLPQGWLAARFGRKALMSAFFLGTGLCLIVA